MDPIRDDETSRVADEVLPVHSFDDTALNRAMAVTGLMRYRSVLDGEKLRDALVDLFQIDEWKKLRGRLRLNAQDKLEIHVPSQVTDQRPAIRYRQTALDIPIGSHPVVSRLAQTTPASRIQPAIASFPDDIASILVPQEWPRSLQDYVDPGRDEPIFGLHVLTFSDATLVVLKYSHVIMDGGGRGALMKAWSNMLHGRKSLVPSIGGTRKDPLDAVRERREPVEPFVLADKRIELGALMPEDGKTAPGDPDWDTSSPESCWRTVSLSSEAISAMVEDARDSAPKGADGSKVFVSEDDIVTAWFIRTVAGMIPAGRPINTMRVYNLRNRLPVFDPEMAYVQNAYQMAWALFPSAGETAKAALGEVAARLRSSLQQQTTEAQAISSMAERDAGITPLYGSPSGMFFTFNSWDQIKLYQAIDFSPAVVDSGGQGHVPSGLPDLIDFDFALGGAPPGPNIISSGKDALGTRHAMAFLSNVMWPRMEEALAKLA